MTTTRPAIIRFTVAVPLALAVLFSVPAQRGAAGTTIGRAGSTTSLGAAASLHRMSNGKIAFLAGQDDPRLDVINPDGSGLRILARCKTHSCVIADAVWSPDGRRVAFVRGRPPRNNPTTGREVRSARSFSLFVKNADGSGEKRIAGCGRAVWCDYSRLAWSPDGSKIVFTRQRSLYIVNVETHALRRITNGLRHLPNCGSRFVSRAPKHFCVDLGPAWSPDGRRITFFRAIADGPDSSTRRCGVGCYSTPFIVNPDGSGLRQLTRLQGNGVGPVWSPDGRTIVFHNYFQNYRGIYAIDPDGSRLRLLVAEPPASANQIQFLSSWSPDGRRILYARVQYSYPGSANAEVWVMNANGSEQRRLFAQCCGVGLGFPIWSPDGEHIAFSAYFAKQEDSGIYLMDADGSHLHRVLASNGVDVLTWQPTP